MITDDIAWPPRDPGLNHAFVLWRRGDLRHALFAMSAAVQSAPTDPDAWRGLGSVRWSCGDFDGALDAFRTALNLEYWSPVHWATVGLALRDLRRPQHAAHALRTATRIDPTYVPAWNELANVLVDCGHPRDALPLYERVLALDDSRAVYHHNRGVALRLVGDRLGAQRAFEAALDCDSGYQWSIQELQQLLDCRPGE